MFPSATYMMKFTASSHPTVSVTALLHNINITTVPLYPATYLPPFAGEFLTAGPPAQFLAENLRRARIFRSHKAGFYTSMRVTRLRKQLYPFFFKKRCLLRVLKSLR